MTVSDHEMHTQHEQTHGAPEAAAGQRRRWLIPALAIGGAIAAVLVISGLVSASLLVYAALFGGMFLMHAGGHGGHGGHGGGTPPAPR